MTAMCSRGRMGGINIGSGRNAFEEYEDIFRVRYQFGKGSGILKAYAAMVMTIDLLWLYNISPLVQVYVRRAYVSYEIHCLRHLDIGLETCVVQFSFLLPTSHPNRVVHARVFASQEEPGGSPSSGPLERLSLSHALALECDSCIRMGVMAAFTNFQDLGEHFQEFMELLLDSETYSPRIVLDNSEAFSPPDRNSLSLGPTSGFVDRASNAKVKNEEPSFILNVAVRLNHESDDKHLSCCCEEFCQAHLDSLKKFSVRRITFVLLVKYCHPKYFTFRARDGFIEDRIYRHLEPSLAFQLEINRMSTYNLEALPTSNQKMHLYLGKAKVRRQFKDTSWIFHGIRGVAKGQEVTDYRFFVRSIIRHSDLVTKEASFEYMQNEGERLLLEAMDELEVAFSHPLAKRTDCNHIFLNFVPCVIMDPSKIEESVRSMVLRYGPRLWKLRVLQAELKINIRTSPSSKNIPIRLCLANESGYYLDVCLYKEVPDPRTGVMRFEAFGGKQGALNGLPISAPYMTKDYLQLKRFHAQSNGTTYVYDFPDMFRQSVERQWHKFSQSHPQAKLEIPGTVMTCVELVMDKSMGNVIEQKRLPGENQVGMVAWKMRLHTPEYPEGRDLVVIANDITHQIGSFGPGEDELFLKASQLARSLGIPRIYLAANSGARIGLAEEIKHLFRIAWEDLEEPNKDKIISEAYCIIYVHLRLMMMMAESMWIFDQL
ncbi:unnamed protein product [Darwinula stevensoni]|uniref:CoA carboxyltransferase N-terminal domain-containing protein n=1 Tax=Darwinula stevensoni TaxID=69355 RepID=A0A7R9A190_9CRUS|nr:unnamed protein product [Darwinula stevensoni]CAG0886140.1 unnamed protein product [Darwinula stevensoni]